VEQMQIGKWSIEYSTALTREAYEHCVGSPETCSCSYCQNWVQVRHFTYPPEALAIFERLGINPKCEAEVWEVETAPGSHLYSGWFHFVGRIVEEEDVRAFRTHALTASFSIEFSSRIALAAESFHGLPLVRLEFVAEAVPWVTDTL